MGRPGVVEPRIPCRIFDAFRGRTIISMIGAGGVTFALTLASTPARIRTVTFEERVRAQETIERLYYEHQIGASRPFAEAVPRAALERKVARYLRLSAEIERERGRPLTAEMLRRELERIAASTRLPDRLEALYDALGRDSVLIQECLARPALVGRLTASRRTRRGAGDAFGQIDTEAARAMEAGGAVEAGGSIQDLQERSKPEVSQLAASHRGRNLASIATVATPMALPSPVHRQSSIAYGDGLEATGSRSDVAPLAPLESPSATPSRSGMTSLSGSASLPVAPSPLPAPSLSVASSPPGSPSLPVASSVQGSPSVPASPVPLSRAPSSGASPDRLLGSGVPPSCVGDNGWENASLDDPPTPRRGSTAVWTGSWVIVFGGYPSGERYDPVLDLWERIATANEPAHRYEHTAVWTGSEVIVWGGREANSSAALATGGRYDPVADRWRPTALAGAPSPRGEHTAVWTGTRMVVWGGASSNNGLDTGGVYDPGTDAWVPTSTAGAPQGRSQHTAVWTGTEMIVFGGLAPFLDFGDGGAYNPAHDSWRPLSASGAPSPRVSHTAVWTGTVMLVWGGRNNSGVLFATGGRYDPASDSWTPITDSGAPSARSDHTALWTGSRMLVWGGGLSFGQVATGASYDPVADSWSPTSNVDAPAPRSAHAAVWTGSRMVVWGGWGDAGYLDTGGRYDPATDSWQATARGDAPSPRDAHRAVWTGSLMLVWGGEESSGVRPSSGGRYDPLLDAWSPMSETGAPAGRVDFSVVWTGSEMIVWGGATTTGIMGTGGRYDPIADVWQPVSQTGAPEPRSSHVAVWTGSRMVVWGGLAISPTCRLRDLDTGALYDPASDAWTPMATAFAPTARTATTAVWTGSRMIVWGGQHNEFCVSSSRVFLDSGGQYDPVSNLWTPTSGSSVPPARAFHTAIWTGTTMIVWGGRTVPPEYPTPGGRYDPVTNSWSPISTAGEPYPPRYDHEAVWTGSRMVVWGGIPAWSDLPDPYQGGGRYDPATDTWRAISSLNEPAARLGATAVWTGEVMIVWGGQDLVSRRDDGGRYGVGRPNADGDGLADACDPCPLDAANDGDGDGLCGNVDNCPAAANPDQVDGDGDGVGTVCDVCPADADPAQTDSDGDGPGDACDACPRDAGPDPDSDFVCTSSDNCPAARNPVQTDGDGDGRGNLCDNCPGAANAGQSDGDGDGAGDACDCQPSDATDRRPGEVGGLTASRTGSSTASLTWLTAAGADAYALSRGRLSAKGPGQYGSCLAEGSTATSFLDAGVPPAGDGWFYLVQGQSYDCGLGTLGFTSQEQERINADPSACHGVVVTDVHASAESTVFGTVSGSFADTATSNDVSETITEVLSTGGNPSQRFSRLEHRWTFVVVPGSRKELHVEGFRSASADGDDFRFEFSTDGVSFTPIPLPSLPFADDDLDRVGLLPAGLTGAITVRVVDTDRTAGYQSFDTVASDEVFIRVLP